MEFFLNVTNPAKCRFGYEDISVSFRPWEHFEDRSKNGKERKDGKGMGWKMERKEM